MSNEYERVFWMIERMLAAHPGSSVRIDLFGEKRDGSLYHAVLVTPQGHHHEAPAARDAFEAVHALYQHMAARALAASEEAKRHMEKMGLADRAEP